MTRKLALLVSALGLMAWALVRAQPAGPFAAVLEIDGPIGPATSGYFQKAHEQAQESGAALTVLRIDTPGGLDTAMRDIIKDIVNSPIPVACLVAPGGARAASAGTYILYACHVAAMAPATNLGAATPVPVGGPMPGPAQPGDDKGSGEGEKGSGEETAKDEPAASGDAMSRKVLNDAVAYIRSLAEKRGRNADWAEKAVREGASLSAEQALKEDVIDLMANDVQDLLHQIDGRTVALPSGEVTLQTANLRVETIAPDWRMKLLSVLTNPTVAYILMLIGIYGLLLEGYNPGALVPGVTGAICLLLALYAFQLLPVNYVGLALMLLGVALMVAEALSPSVGALGFGGVVAFVMGSIMLMDIDVPGYGVNLGVIIGIATSAAALLALTLFLLWRARRAPMSTGDSILLGHRAEVLEVHNGDTWVMVHGERWSARSHQPLHKGEQVRVVGVDGLTLLVEPETKP